jgi:hypothetical protein
VLTRQPECMDLRPAQLGGYCLRSVQSTE